jgi:hypothetical protein
MPTAQHRQEKDTSMQGPLPQVQHHLHYSKSDRKPTTEKKYSNEEQKFMEGTSMFKARGERIQVKYIANHSVT